MLSAHDKGRERDSKLMDLGLLLLKKNPSSKKTEREAKATAETGGSNSGTWMLSDYELAREKNIRDRDAKLIEMGLIKKKPVPPPRPPPLPKDARTKKSKYDEKCEEERKRRPLTDRIKTEQKENIPPLRSQRSTAKPKNYAVYELSDEEDVDDPGEGEGG